MSPVAIAEEAAAMTAIMIRVIVRARDIARMDNIPTSRHARAQIRGAIVPIVTIPTSLIVPPTAIARTEAIRITTPA